MSVLVYASYIWVILQRNAMYLHSKIFTLAAIFTSKVPGNQTNWELPNSLQFFSKNLSTIIPISKMFWRIKFEIWICYTFRVSGGSRYLATFSGVIEHFQIAPVAAARRSLLSTAWSSETNGSRPPNWRTRSRVLLSSAHYGRKLRFILQDRNLEKACAIYRSVIVNERKFLEISNFIC